MSFYSSLTTLLDFLTVTLLWIIPWILLGFRSRAVLIIGEDVSLVLLVRVALSFTLWRHFCNDLKCCWSRVTSYNEQESSLWTRLDWMDRTNKTFIQVTALHVHVTPKVVTPTLRYVPGLRELFLTKQFLCWNLKKLRLFEMFLRKVTGHQQWN